MNQELRCPRCGSLYVNSLEMVPAVNTCLDCALTWKDKVVWIGGTTEDLIQRMLDDAEENARRRLYYFRGHVDSVFALDRLNRFGQITVTAERLGSLQEIYMFVSGMFNYSQMVD